MFVFFIDIDGTLKYNDTVTERTVDTILKAQEAGHRFFINTARHYTSIPVQIRNLPFDGFIASYATTILTDGDYVRRECFSFDCLKRYVQYAFENDLKIFLASEERSLWVNNSDPSKLNLKCAEDLEQKHKNIKVSKICVYHRGEEMERFLGEGNNIYLFPAFFEIVPLGYTKAKGISFVEDYYKIPHENTVAIGDTVHDLDMITYAQYGVAMGDGQRELIDVTKYVTKSLAEDGVAFTVESIINGNISAITK